MAQHRLALTRIFQAAIAAVNGRHTVASWLKQNPPPVPLALLALGKAAPAMAAGAFEVLGGGISAALVITKQGYAGNALAGLPAACLESAHPVPDASSIRAGQAVLDFIHKLPPAFPLLCLISGGASALAEAPSPGLSLAELQRVNTWLLGSGLDIHAVNLIRKQLSAIKGGRLVKHVQGRPVFNLLMSDVPGDMPEAVGSGLLVPHTTQTLPAGLPSWLQDLLARPLPLPSPQDFTGVHTRIIASAAIARAAAAQEARRLGYAVTEHPELLTGDAAETGKRLGSALKQRAQAGLDIYAGETVVRLPPSPGQGGRCRHLALAAALEISGQAGCYVLAGASDGNDGTDNAAGALADSGTVERGRQAGLDAAAKLSAADSGSFLSASGDSLMTGATGTNVMDSVFTLRT